MSSESAPDRLAHRVPGDWKPTAPWENLRRRSQLLQRLRAFFDDRGFVEVETPLLSADTVVDRHLEPIIVPNAEGAPPRFLQTSPEFAMKRLLASGAGAIYQVTRAFRAEELGPLHNPEFTMVEWYRAGDSPEQGMQRLGDLADTILRRGPAQLLSYRDAFQSRLGLDPHTASVEQFRAAAAKLDGEPPEFGDDTDGWRFYLLTHAIEPQLGSNEPVILFDYPASQAALATLNRDSQGEMVAKRFELYVDGIELANGYFELLDPGELRQRNASVNQQRHSDRKSALPVESRLLAAMEHGLPSCCGVALGFDRLVMCALGAKTLDEVMAFPWPRA